jgi:hypothetical protein
VRRYVIDQASKVQELILKCIEEYEKEEMDGDSRFDAPSAVSEQKIRDIHEAHLKPSEAAQNSALRLARVPNNPQGVFNGRPTALTGPCLSIYHLIFQTFMREYNSPVAFNQIRSLDYEHANLFVSVPVQYFKDEDARFFATTPPLQHFFGPTFKFHGVMHSERRHWIPDGHAPVTCGLYNSTDPGYWWMVACINEMENGLGVGNADPVERMQGKGDADKAEHHTAPRGS